jgi:hypothetical protein
LGSVLKITIIAQNFALHCITFGKKMSWATFWAIFKLSLLVCYVSEWLERQPADDNLSRRQLGGRPVAFDGEGLTGDDPVKTFRRTG